MSKRNPLKVIAGTPDKPLVIGNVEIPCYVLEDETRVLSQGGFLQAIGRSRSPKAGTGGVDNPPVFLAPKNLEPFVSRELLVSTTPIPFQTTEGRKGYGYLATLLPGVCEVYLEARDAGALLPSQQHMAVRAEVLIRGLARVGIISLVDEATGYQELREQRALATILEKFIARELQPWTKTFPYEFYEQIFRLKGWDGPKGKKRPQVIGHYTNDFVYARIAPGVLEELKRINPTLPTGRRGSTHHQWFTPDLGHPKLKEHLAAVIALMRASPNWDSFQRNLNRALPKVNDPYPLILEE
ncbi:MAG: P63C domain-containing protein [Truepera sp.]|nr:P63C domain-containing protein [Truepera sp.]